MSLVQILLTADQASKVESALKRVLEDDRVVMEEDEQAQFEQLAGFFQLVSENPSKFPPSQTTPSIKRMVRGVKGPAQTKGQMSPRKIKKLRRQSGQKMARAQKRELAQKYNEAQERSQRDMAEMEEAFQEQRKELQSLLNKLSSQDLYKALDLLGVGEAARSLVAETFK